jgi:hypothetical protein
MKPFLKVFTLIALFFVTFTACNPDDEEPVTYWLSFATYHTDSTTTNGYYLWLDSGGKIIPQNKGTLEQGLANGDRVIANYSIVTDSGQNQNRVITANMVSVTEILTKDIFELTTQTYDSIGNDFIHITQGNIWATQNHLNIIFEYSGGTRQHFINLCKPIGPQTDSLGRQILLFKHNANSDWGGTWIQGAAAFNMNSIKPAGADSLNFVMLWTDYDYLTKQFEGTFYYSNNSTKSTPIFKTNSLKDHLIGNNNLVQ